MSKDFMAVSIAFCLVGICTYIITGFMIDHLKPYFLPGDWGDLVSKGAIGIMVMCFLCSLGGYK